LTLYSVTVPVLVMAKYDNEASSVASYFNQKLTARAGALHGLSPLKSQEAGDK
jgi:hypothetical protein